MIKYIFFFILILNIHVSYTQPELILKTGSNCISSVLSFSSNNKYIIAANNDRTIKLWDLENNKYIKEFIGHNDIVTFVSFLKDNNSFISASMDGTIKIWDINSGKDSTIEPSKTGIKSAALSEDQYYLLGATWDGNLSVWDLRSGWKYNSFGKIESEYTKISFSNNNKRIVAASNDNFIRVYDPFTGELIFSIDEHNNSIGDVCYAPDGNTIATCGSDSLIKMWNSSNGNLIKTLSKANSEITTIAYTTDGQYLIYGGENSTLSVYDLNKDKILSSLMGHKLSIKSVIVSNDGYFAASSSDDGTIKIWNLQSNKELFTFSGSKSIVSSICFYNNGKNFVSANYDGSVTLWDLEFGTIIGYFKIHDLPITNVTVSHNNQYILTSSNDETIKLFEIKNSNIINTFRGHEHIVSSCAFTPDDKYIVSSSYDKKIKIWDTETGIEKMDLKGHTNVVTSLSISPDGSQILSGGGDSLVILWDFITGKILNIFKGHKNEVSSVAFSNDGKFAYSDGLDRKLLIWDLYSYTLKDKINRMGYYVSSIAVSNNNNIASGNYDQNIYFWDSKDKFNDISPLEGHKNVVSCLSFSADGKFLASGSWDGTIKLWNTIDHINIATFVPIENEEYIINTPSNYYSCSKNGYKYVFFKLSGTEYPFEQFDLIFNRPDIVLTNLGYASKEIVNSYKRGYEQRLKSLNIQDNSPQINTNLPELSIVNKKEIKSINYNGIATIHINALDNMYRLFRLNILINNIPIYGKDGFDLTTILNYKYTSYSYNDNIDLNLSNGINKIQVSVMNEKGVESLKDYMEIYYNKVVDFEKPDLYAIVIGVSNYKDSLLDLQYASKDASDFALFLEDNKNKYQKTNIITLLNSEATKDRIQKTKDVLNKSKINDEVIIFISGQGLLNNNLNYYFATYDVNYKKPDKNGLSMENLEDLFDGIPARKRLLLMNTSNSGEIDYEDAKSNTSPEPCITLIEHGIAGIVKSCRIKGAYELQKNSITGYKSSIELAKNLFVNLSNESGAVIIASSSGSYEYPYVDDKYSNGVFTYSIIDGLNNLKADINNDGIIMVSELKEYVIKTVKEMTNDYMKPVVRKEILNYDFKIWTN